MLLAIGAIGLVLIFKKSDNLADAYGLAVTGTMATTTIAYAVISYAITKRIPWIAAVLLVFDLSLFIPNSTKFFTGGYIPVTVGVIVAFILVSWDRTRRAIRAQLAEVVMPLEEFCNATKEVHRVRNTAVVLSASPKIAPPSLLHWLKIGQVLHQQVIVLTLVVTAQPRVAEKGPPPRGGARWKSLWRRGRLRLHGGGERLEARAAPEKNRERAARSPALLSAGPREFGAEDRSSTCLRRLIAISRARAAPISEALNIPAGQVIEIGTTIRI